MKRVVSLADVTEIDLDGYVDERGIEYLGRAARQPDGTWRCAAVVESCLCVVELKLTPAVSP